MQGVSDHIRETAFWYRLRRVFSDRRQSVPAFAAVSNPWEYAGERFAA
jgi:hypothetical protein